MAKRRDARYRPGTRSSQWLKLKHEEAQEVLVVGWRPGKGGRTSSIGSLLLAAPDDDGELRYVGRVGSGFTDRVLKQLRERLEPVRRDDPLVPTPRDVAREAVWVDPVVVAEVTFGGWTDSGHLRHPVWRGLRDDKSPADL